MKKFFEKLNAVSEVVNSMKANPDDWQVNEFRAVNRKTQSSIWHSNDEYGIDFTHNGVKYISGVTYMSSLLGWMMPWRRKLIKACRKHIILYGLDCDVYSLRD